MTSEFPLLWETTDESFFLAKFSYTLMYRNAIYLS